jgi:hypothetical protein
MKFVIVVSNVDEKGSNIEDESDVHCCGFVRKNNLVKYKIKN